MRTWLDPLRQILDRLPAPARFIFCDDHVRRDEPSFQGMLDLFAAHQVPIDLGLRPALPQTFVEALQARMAVSDGRIALHRQGLPFGRRAPAIRPATQAPSLAARARGGAWAALERRLLPEAWRAQEATSAPAVLGSANATVPVSVDWCSHRPGADSAQRVHLGRLLAVAASRGRPVAVLLDHTQCDRLDLARLEDLLVLLANHRGAECLLVRQLAGVSRAVQDDSGATHSHAAVQPDAAARPAAPDLPPPRAFPWLPTRLSHAGSRWLLLAVAVVAVAVLAWRTLGGGEPAGRFLTAKVVRGDIESAVLASGTLQPFEFVDVGAQTSGQLKSVKVQLGDKVLKGQLLAEIDPVINASKVAEAEATLANLKAQRDAKQDQVWLATKQKTRSDDLARQGAQAASDAEIAASNFRQARDALAALDAQIRQAEAELATARANLAYTRITAPMSGEVVSLPAREGQTLNASQTAPTLMRIASLDTMTVWAQVPEADVSRLHLGQEIYFSVLGENERRWHSTLRQILPSPEIIANVVFYDALFDVPNPERELKVQMTTQVSFVLDRAKDALLVPLPALLPARPREGGEYVVKRLSNGKVKRQPVRVGITNALSAQILSGLNEGDTIVVGEAEGRRAGEGAGALHPVPRAR